MVTFKNEMNDLNGLIKMSEINAALRYNQADNRLQIDTQISTNTMTSGEKTVCKCLVLEVVNFMSWNRTLGGFLRFWGAFSLISQVKTGISNSV